MFINLGGANFRHAGWTNIDYPFERRAYKQDQSLIDISHNFMEKQPLPLKNASVQAIYTEHCIEHLTYDAVKFLLKDVYRILMPKGLLRISCPDATILYKLFEDASVPYIGFTHKKKHSHKAIELLDAICTPLINQMSVKAIKKIYSQSISCEAFFTHIESLCPVITIENQKKYPGHHLTWWNYNRLKKLLTSIGFRKIKCRGPRESTAELFKSSYIDNTAPSFSIRIECAK